MFPVGGTAIYGLYRYVPLWRVWFSSSLLKDFSPRLHERKANFRLNSVEIMTKKF